MVRVPPPHPDEVSQDWWNATIEKRLTIQQCRSCCHWQHYPRPFCLACEDVDLALVEASGFGKIHSWTVIYRSPYEDLPAPYVVALVDLDEGVRLLTRLVDCDADQLACDLPVTMRWIAAPGEQGYNMPVFTLRARHGA